MDKNALKQKLQKCVDKCNNLPDNLQTLMKAGQMGCDHVQCCHDTLDKAISVVDSVLEHLGQCPNDNPDQAQR